MSAAALVLAAALAGPGGHRPTAPAADPPPAITEAERAERIAIALGTIHGAPSPGSWRALGPEAVPALAALARDPGALPSRRARALDGLSHLGGEAAASVLREVAARDDAPFSVRAAAMEGAGRLLPAVDVRLALEPVLRGARRPADRAVAAEVLVERVPAAGCPAVRARLPREAERDRAAFGRALSRCAALGR